MRTLVFSLIIATLSSAAIAAAYIWYNSPPSQPQHLRIIKSWERGNGDAGRTHTSGHGYYIRRADRRHEVQR